MNQPPLLSSSLQQRMMAADLNNAPPQEKKALYREQNCFEISENAPVYRIFQFRYLAEDIKKKQLTHVKPEAWNDPLENPLLKHTWTEPTGETVSLRGILDKLFGQSWTLNRAESQSLWQVFSHGQTAVRIQTTAGKLLNGVMSLDNRFYMLSHFIGKAFIVTISGRARATDSSTSSSTSPLS